MILNLIFIFAIVCVCVLCVSGRWWWLACTTVVVRGQLPRVCSHLTFRLDT